MPLPLFVPAFALIMASLALAARADMDHAAEARRAAQRQEAAHQAAQQKSRDEATKKAAMARGYRGMLGAKAAGKSDAEVIRMGEQWQADAMRQGSESARSQPRLTPEAASAYRANAARPQAAAEDMVRRGTGGQRRVEDLENMSEAELEAMVRKAGAQGAAKR